MLGTVLLILGLPLWLSGAARLPLLLIPLLLFAPQITVLLQLALSRAREFDADLDAAGLTQDPDGLASALLKLERYQRGVWEQILWPGRRLPEPSMLRTHPPTEQRVERLRRLSAAAEPPAGPSAIVQAIPWPAVAEAPHGRLIGFWH
jgi:heat shock protein HtpX